MEHRRLIRPIVWIMVLAMVLSMLSGVTVFAATGTVSRNTETRHVVAQTLSTKAKAYYTGNYTYAKLSGLSGVYSPNDSWAATQNNPLYNALQTLMSSTHTTYAKYNPTGETKDELSYLWDYTDSAKDSSNEYLYFYTDVSAADISADMQREHVWPESKASYFQTNGGSDLHHLRPSVSTVNGNKSCFTFANVRKDYKSYKTTTINGENVLWYLQTSSGSEVLNGVVEPKDNIKGDVARILLYIWCRWGEPNLYSDVDPDKCPTMDSNDNGDNQTGLKVIESMDILLEWMAMDPVDTWEMTRNDQAENFQGNRNVFIDYPELAWLVLGQTPPYDITTPSGEAAKGSYTITATSNDSLRGTVSVSKNVITAAPAKGYYAAGYTVISGNATVVQSGNTFTVSPTSDCVIRINFERASSYTISFSVPKGVSQTAMTGSSGSTITLPTPSGKPVSYGKTYTFLGWTESELEETVTKPSYYAAGSSYTVTGDATLYALYSYSDSEEEGYYLQVTAESQLKVNAQVVIAASTAAYALSTTQNSNNRGQASIKKDSANKTMSFTSSVAVLTLESGLVSGTYAFYDPANNGYLYAANSSGNYLRTEKNLSNNSSFAITLNSDGTSTLVAQGSNTRNILRYNPGNSIFSCYNSSSTNTKAVQMYVLTYDQTEYYTTVITNDCNHNYTSSVTKPSCTEEGCTTYTCTLCGDSYKENVVEALGHNYAASTTNASCEKDGSVSYLCGTCGHSYTETIPAFGHSFKTSVIKEASCTAEGQMSCTCTTCGYNYTETIPALEHNYSNGLCTMCGAQSLATTYALVTASSGLTSGNYILVVKAGGSYSTYNYYAMKCENSGNYITSVPMDSYMGTSLPANIYVADDSLVWNLKVSGSSVSLYDLSGKGLYFNSSNSMNLSTSATSWSYSFDTGSKTFALSVSSWLYRYVLGLRDDVSNTGNNGMPLFYISSSGNVTSSHSLYLYKEVSGTAHKHSGSKVEGTEPTCVNDGVASHWSCACGKLFSDQACTKEITATSVKIPALGHSYSYKDNGNNHSVTCANGCGYTASEAHSYTGGTCVCGAKENAEPVVDSAISLGEQLYLESDLTLTFRIRESYLQNYDVSTAYLVVERDVYATDGTMSVDVQTLRDFNITGGRVIFSYSGIAASQMNDEIRAIFYIQDSNGKTYRSAEKVTSITLYAKTLIESVPTGQPKLYAVLMDMLNYGTAAQIYFKRHADAPANEAYAIFADYAQYASAELSTALEDLSGQIENPGATTTISQALDLGTRIGITYKVALPSGVDAASAVLVIKDEGGNELETIDLSTGTVDNRGRYVVNFYGNASRQMRRVVYATVYVNGVAISNTYTYSISSYAYAVANTAGMSADLINLTNLMVAYGDSAAVYFG